MADKRTRAGVRKPITPDKEEEKKKQAGKNDRLELAQSRGLNAGVQDMPTAFIPGQGILTESEVATKKQTEIDAPLIAQQQALQQRVLDQPANTATDIATQGERGVINSERLASIPLGLGTIATGFNSFKDSATFKKIQDGTATTQEILQAKNEFQLDDVDIEVIKAGEANVSKLSNFAESIPLIGKLRIRAGGFNFGTSDLFGSSTSKKVDDLTTTLKATEGSIDQWTQLAISNPARAQEYLRLIRDAENEALKLESRIKLFTIQSPTAQSEPEKIIQIETEIDNVKGSIQGNRDKLIQLGLR